MNSDENSFEDFHLNGLSCQAFSELSFNNYFNQSIDNFLLMHINSRSYTRNFDEFGVLLDTLNRLPDVLVVTETWFSSDTSREISGYYGYHLFRSGKRGGGVSVYIKDTLISTSVTDKTFLTDIIEVNTVVVTLNSNINIYFVAIYRPPEKQHVSDFNISLGNLIGSFSGNARVYVVGDINIDLLQRNENANEYCAILQSLSYVPLITIPTRVTDTTETLLDHIWTNQLHNINSGTVHVSTTDHFPVFASTHFDEGREVSPFVKKFFRDHSKASIERLRTDCIAMLGELARFDELDTCTRINIFHDKIYDIYNKTCPLRSKFIPRKNFLKPWISDRIKIHINQKHFLFRQYRKGLVSFELYNNYKNMCTKLLKQAKIDYFKLKFDNCRNDLKKTWHNINYLINSRRNTRTINRLCIGGVDVTGEQLIANAFNNHFSSVGVALDRAIPVAHNKSPLDYMSAPVPHSLFLIPTDSREVRNIIMGLSNRSSHGKTIPPYIYKCLSDVLSPVVADLFNDTIMNGGFPESLKVARVVPLFKSGSRQDYNNYRPISTLPVLSKIFEKLMYTRLSQFLKDHEIIVNHQFEFQKGSSTSDAILEFLDQAYQSLNSKQYLIAVYLDFSKAFDTVNHDILLLKLQHYGIRGVVNDWFRSYLSDRKQYITVENSSSNMSVLSMGVPQGTILGPILFLLYVNDMCRSSSLKYIHFADDTTLIASSPSYRGLYHRVNSELKLVDGWLRVNRLSLNLKKTKHMIITNCNIDNRRKLRIRNKVIKRVFEIKFLGVMIDAGLRFSSHISYISAKLYRAVGVVNRASCFMPFAQRLSLYYSLIYPHLIYGVVVWGRASSGGEERMKRLQRRAFRAISGGNLINPLRVTQLLNIVSIYKYFTAVKVYQVMIEQKHLYFYNKIISFQTQHDHNTRFQADMCLVPPLFRLTQCQNSFLYRCIDIWNEIPFNIRNCGSLKRFKILWKNHLTSIQGSV